MARHTAVRPLKDEGSEVGDQYYVAHLELEHHATPELWPGYEREPTHWPASAVASLIQLFTGRNPNDDDEGNGLQIPDSLGWHIAVLIDHWADGACSLGYETADINSDQDQLTEYLAATSPTGDYPSKQALEHAKQVLLHQHARHRQDLVQRWYSDGIRLFQAES